MEGHATDGAQVCREGWPDGAVVVHKGAGLEAQMARGWIKRFPAALMGARRATRYTDGNKQTKAHPRLRARRRGAKRVPRVQENIVTSGWTTAAGMVQKTRCADDGPMVIRVVRRLKTYTELYHAIPNPTWPENPTRPRCDPANDQRIGRGTRFR